MTEALTRKPDWEPRLAAYLARAAKLQHRFGRHDCMINAANAVKAVTGRDFARGHRGKYRGRVSAIRYREQLGYSSDAAMLDALLPAIEPAFARRGDLVLAAPDIPGICLGGTAAFVGLEPGKDGLVTLPRSAWTRAWSVG